VTAVFLALGAASAHSNTVLAVVGPESGPYASFFDQVVHGAKAAVEAINAAGGLQGQKLELRIEDDACDPRQAVMIANNLAGQDVAAVIGHFCASSSIPASDVYAEAGIPMISPATSNPMLTERGLPTVFRTSGRDDQQAIAAASQIIKIVRREPGTRIAIVNDKSTYGKGITSNLRAALHEARIVEVANDTLTQGEKDFSALISRLKSVKPDLVYFGGFFAEGGLLVRQARQQGLEALFMGGDGIAASQFAAIAGPAAEGFLMTFYRDPRDDPKAAAIVKRFRDSGYDPEGFTLYTYAAVQVYVQAATLARSTDGLAVAKALHTGTFNTVLGKFSFNKKGDPSTEPFILYVWRGGKYVPAP
jgi:branched-chain amino acid transport system substrate-binding protein